MPTKQECLARFENILNNFSEDDIPDHLMDQIEFEMKKSADGSVYVKHETVKLQHFTNYDIDIDKNIAELVKYIWQCRIDTDCSCENNVPRGYIWICFSTSNDAERFLKIVTKDDDGSELYARILDGIPGTTPNAWIYDLNIVDRDYDEESGRLYNELYISVSIRFPQSDYEWVCEKFREYLSQNK